MPESQHSRYLLFFGGLSAVFASLCCLGPLLLLVMGFSGAWLANLAVLEPYRPVFIILSLIALFFAGQRIFQSAPNCKVDGSCSQPPVHRQRVVIFWFVVVLVSSALVFPYLLPLFY